MHDLELPRDTPLPPGYRWGTEFTGPKQTPLRYLERAQDNAFVIVRLLDVAQLLEQHKGWSR